MNKTVKNILSYALMSGAAIFLVWFSLKGIQPLPGQTKLDFLLETWNKANKFLFVLSALVAVLSHIVRAERWRLLLKPIGYSVGLVPSFFSVMGGYFVNLAIPRGGEIYRCVNLFRLNKVPVETSAGTVVVERLIDVVFLLTFIGASFLLEYDKLLSVIQDFFAERSKNQVQANNGFPVFWVVIGVALICLAGFLLWAGKNGKLKSIFEKIKEIWANMKKGLLSVFLLDKKGLFLFYSFAIWVLYFIMAWLCMLAFEQTKILGLEAALMMFTLGSIAMAMPFPGGTGSYHFLVPLGLATLYGLTKGDAIGFTVIFHAWQTLVIIVFGFISVIGSQILNNKKA